MRKSAIINIKIDPRVKMQAKKVAEELGFSLSSLVNAYFKTLIKTKEVHFVANPREEPSEYMIKAIKEAEKERGDSPTFSNAKNAIAWLKNKSRKYED